MSGDADVCEGSSLVCFGISLTVNAGTFFFNSRWPNGFADCIDFFFITRFEPARSRPIRKNEAGCQNARGSIVITRQTEKCDHPWFAVENRPPWWV